MWSDWIPGGALQYIEVRGSAAPKFRAWTWGNILYLSNTYPGNHKIEENEEKYNLTMRKMRKSITWQWGKRGKVYPKRKYFEYWSYEFYTRTKHWGIILLKTIPWKNTFSKNIPWEGGTSPYLNILKCPPGVWRWREGSGVPHIWGSTITWTYLE